MKKIFTLISVVLCAMSVNAQTESFHTVDADGNMVSQFSNPTTSGTDLIVNVSTENVTMKAVASKTPADIANSSGAGLNQDTWTAWTDAKWEKKNRGDINFWWVQGTGNPYISFVSEQKSKDGELIDEYKANYTYYNPDGTAGLPRSGEYVEFTSKVNGMFKIGFWANKGGSRKLYIVKKSDAKALQWSADANSTQYKVEGYIQGATKTDGTMIYLNSINVDEYVIGNTSGDYSYKDEEGTDKTVAAWNQPKFGYFVFDAVANETYLIFGSDWQFGIQGYEFTPGATIRDYTPGETSGVNTIKAAEQNANAPIYNLAGQQVDKSYKGVVIQNGTKRIQK